MLNRRLLENEREREDQASKIKQLENIIFKLRTESEEANEKLQLKKFDFEQEHMHKLRQAEGQMQEAVVEAH